MKYVNDRTAPTTPGILTRRRKHISLWLADDLKNSMDERFLATAAVALALGGAFGSGFSRIGEVEALGPIAPLNPAVEATMLPSTASQAMQAPEDHVLEAKAARVLMPGHSVRQGHLGKHEHAARQEHAVKQGPAVEDWAVVKQAPAFKQEADSFDHASIVPSVSATSTALGRAIALPPKALPSLP